MTRASGVDRKVGHGVERGANITMNRPSSIMTSQTARPRARDWTNQRNDSGHIGSTITITRYSLKFPSFRNHHNSQILLGYKDDPFLSRNRRRVGNGV
jgi:hypothetical protein